jgi:3-oxoacyl-[acyl-carrier-protein] synthase II
VSLAVTGVGVIAAEAQGRSAFARSLVSAPSEPEAIEIEGKRLSIRRVSDPAPVPPREARRLTRPALFALAAAQEALEPLGKSFDANDVGVAVGTGYGSIEETRLALDALLERADHLSPAHFVASVRHEAQSAVARLLGLRGPAICASSRRLSFEDALAWSAVQLRAKRARAIVVVGTDEVTPLSARLFRRSRLTGEHIVLGEGAGALLLEREDDARAAGRAPLAILRAWVSGVGSPVEEAAAIDRATERNGVSRERLELFLDDSEGSKRRKLEREALLEALEYRGIRPLETLPTAEHTGHAPSAGAFVAVAAALAVSGAVPKKRPRAALVSAREADGSFAAYVLDGAQA